MRYLRGDDDDDDLVALVDIELSSRAGRSVNFSSGSGLESETATLASNGKQQEQTAAKKKQWMCSPMVVLFSCSTPKKSNSRQFPRWRRTCVVRSGAIFSTTSTDVSSNVQSGTQQCSRLRQSRFKFNHLLNNDEVHLGDNTFPFLRKFLTLREKFVG